MILLNWELALQPGQFKLLILLNKTKQKNKGKKVGYGDDLSEQFCLSKGNSVAAAKQSSCIHVFVGPTYD